tara:strand:+ start:659 stop:925 length:267 start_codon:yes stop_codon:yes gene_type:complete
MKLYFIVFLIIQSPTEYYFIKIPFSYCYSCEPITCEEQFEKLVTHKIIKGDGIYTLYKGRTVGSHFCINLSGFYYWGYEEKLNWELNQ